MNALLGVVAFAALATLGGWERDFSEQLSVRRGETLEVRYTDATREAFEVEASYYRLTGSLAAPISLQQEASDAPILAVTVEDVAGTVYSTEFATEPTRINLYRRGPYFSEVHWFDIQVADANGNPAPLKGELTLYCYPRQYLASLTWHATDAFDAAQITTMLGKDPVATTPFAKGDVRTFPFPIQFNELLPDTAFVDQDAVAPMRYDALRGCYTIGSQGGGAFQGRFYHTPNRYDSVRFTVTNDATPRTIYVCHENVKGDKGCVEGGVLLDEAGHPLPIVVQISKNFAGEKEEKFYNPEDTAFSETYFPLHLEANETRTVTSLQLYQNWGRHMVKQFSSLGAWMDYFHSSTGVTETTCYVPFKYNGLPGIDIADLRAMSQSAFWGGQPQHDNVAGHSFLSYYADDAWQYLRYLGTTYRSTGPNWMDIQFRYESTDGKIAATVDTFELPQADELRNFVRVRYEVLDTLNVQNAQEDFRLLGIASNVQQLRYTHFAVSDTPFQSLDFSTDNFSVRGEELAPGNAHMALYGEAKGSNAFVLRTWQDAVHDASIGPAASVWCETSGDTRLSLVPDTNTLHLHAGDNFTFSGFWLPYGPDDSADTPAREVRAFGTGQPRVDPVKVGLLENGFPPTIRARDNRAEFTLRGGRDLVSVIITGLTDYRYPRLYRKDERGWRVLSQGRVGELDGVQVFVDDTGKFGAVFLVHSNAEPQELRVTVGEAPETKLRIALFPHADESSRLPPDGNKPESFVGSVPIQASWMDAPILLRFPEMVKTDTNTRLDPNAITRIWWESEGGSRWFELKDEHQVIGGRLTPNEDDVDLEFWMGNQRPEAVPVQAGFCAMLSGTPFDDPTGERTWVHQGGAWARVADAGPGNIVVVTSPDERYVFALVWPDAHNSWQAEPNTCLRAYTAWPACAPGKRIHGRGKLFLMEGTRDDVLRRVRREVTLSP